MALLLPVAERDVVEAQILVGLLYYRGSETVSPDYTKAFAWFQRAAKQNHPGAQYNLAVLYADGTGVAQNYAEAAKWYQIAAEAGYSDAMVNLAYLYKNGLGVSQDNEQALKLYREAAELKNRMAFAGLGDMYAKGLGVPKDPSEALKYYRLAVEHGILRIAGVLGYAYETGTSGVAQDYVEAYKWYTIGEREIENASLLTAQPGFAPEGAQLLSLLISRKYEVLKGIMTAEEIVEGEERARQWRPSAP